MFLKFYAGSMPTRRYGQYCALARTLDVVGERWTLLVVRELLAGPKRYSDVLSALPGIGTSLLAKRLQSLESERLVSRRELPPPAASTVYELTGTGNELALALLPLVQFGARHYLGKRAPDELFRTEWPLLAVAASVDSDDVGDMDDVYEFRIDGSIAYLRCERGRMTVHAGSADHPDVVMTTDVETFVDIGVGRLPPADAIASGRVHLDGSADALQRFVRLTQRVVESVASRSDR